MSAESDEATAIEVIMSTFLKDQSAALSSLPPDICQMAPDTTPQNKKGQGNMKRPSTDDLKKEITMVRLSETFCGYTVEVGGEANRK